jgi:hypothetical protein
MQFLLLGMKKNGHSLTNQNLWGSIGVKGLGFVCINFIHLCFFCKSYICLISAGCEEMVTHSLIKLLHCFCLCFADVNLVNKSTSNIVMKSEAERYL